MEFPHIGQHCSEATCNRLDFLPMKCDSCDKVFCSAHFNYERHACPGVQRKDVQVPVCPLCNEPVPTAPGMAPDITVGQHIDKQCKSDSQKIFTNHCTYKNCKRKELIPVTCTQCYQNFCLRHRHTSDHDCKLKTNGNIKGVEAVKEKVGAAEHRQLTANAAEYRRTNKPKTLFNANTKPNVNVGTDATRTVNTNTNQVESIQGNISEDEALARALALSIMELDESADRKRRNEAAAAAAAAETQQSNGRVPVGGGRVGTQSSISGKDKCSLS